MAHEKIEDFIQRQGITQKPIELIAVIGKFSNKSRNWLCLLSQLDRLRKD